MKHILTPEESKLWRKRYSVKRTSKRKGKFGEIKFLLTYEEYIDVWFDSGLHKLCGRTKEKYCMSRIGDIGDYTVGNVFINGFSQNSREAQLLKGK